MADLPTSYEIIRPTGDGDKVQIGGAGGYANVDDTVADGTTTQNENAAVANTTTVVDLHSGPDSNVGHGTISAVTVVSVVKTPDTGSFGVVVKVGGTEYASASKASDPSSYTTIENSWTTDPDTSSAWTWAAVNALQFGTWFKGTTIPTSTCHVTQTYLRVEYTGSYWKNGAPDDGTDFRFTERQDIALRNYLANYRPTVAGNHADLTDFLNTEAVTWRAHDPFDVLPPGESITNFTMGYIWTTDITTRNDIETNGLVLDGITRIILYAQNDAKPETMGKKWWSVAGAISSLIQQVRNAPDNPEWGCQFANQDHPTVEIGPAEYETEGEDTATVKGTITVSWTHIEDR